MSACPPLNAWPFPVFRQVYNSVTASALNGILARHPHAVKPHVRNVLYAHAMNIQRWKWEQLVDALPVVVRAQISRRASKARAAGRAFCQSEEGQEKADVSQEGWSDVIPFERTGSGYIDLSDKDQEILGDLGLLDQVRDTYAMGLIG